MRRLFRRLIVFASVLGVVMALNVGVAFAAPDGAPGLVPLDDARPVGDHLLGDVPGAPGGENGFGNPNSNALVAIANNPLCPAHPHPNT